MQDGLDSVKVKPVRRLRKKGHGDLAQNISGGNRKGTKEVQSVPFPIRVAKQRKSSKITEVLSLSN